MTDQSTAVHSDGYAVVTGPATVRLERLLPGPIERVWSYLTDSNKRSTWLARGEMDLRIGGRVEHIFNNSELAGAHEQVPEKYAQYAGEARMDGKITAVDPPRLLAYTWSEGHHGSSEVRFDLTPVGDKVQLVITHSRLATRGEMVGVSGGWHVHVNILEAKLKGHNPEPFWKVFAKMEAVYEERIEGD